MCVIAHSAKKRNLPRANVEQCMKSNSSGFFMAELLPDGKRNTIRTLSYDDALKFYDRAGADNPFVLHARIPSYGDKSLENVHGWEEDNVIFMHNMSLRDLDSMMKEDKWNRTDSEYFFREIFIPMYRAFGPLAYVNGKFHPYIDKLVRFFAGSSNRFLFIMPDNVVLKYGNGWVKDFGDTCEFSNSSYKVWTPQPSRTYSGYSGYSGCSSYSGYGYDDDDGYDSWTAPKKASCDGSVFYKGLGTDGILRTALADLVLHNVKDTVVIGGNDLKDVEALENALEDNMPSSFCAETCAEAASLVRELASDGVDEDSAEKALLAYSAALETSYAKYMRRAYGGVYESDVASVSEDLDERIPVMCKLMNVGLNYDADAAKDFATAFVMEKTKKGGIKPVRMDPVDVLCSDGLDLETALKGIETALCILNSPPGSSSEGEAAEKEKEAVK